MDATDFPGLHNLVQCLPFPLVLFDNRSGVGFANDQFATLFGSESIDSPDLHRLAGTPTGAWQTVRLHRADGRELAANAQAVAVADSGVLLIFDTAAGAVVMQETERLQERITELENLSATDPLTGAWNRTHLEDMIGVEMSQASRAGQPITLILLDIDHFKRVNDRYGHLAGDAVLKEFVARIRERMRQADMLFRWGGEEFVVLVTSVGYRGAAVLAKALRKTIASMPFANVGTITASVGVAEYMEGEGAKRWFQRTDQALYAAKSAGRNRVHIDRRGSSDVEANRASLGVLRLSWREAYECGEPTIDGAHRELFDRGNALIAAAIEQSSEPALWRAELELTLIHLAKHFKSEEALLSQYGFKRIDTHRRAHAGLLARADELRAAVEGGEATLGDLVNFLVKDVITLHLLKSDKDFYPLFRTEDNAAR